ncbi:anion exchange protein 2-like isoform X1 [Varroa jacobsoni]|uniref:anion exchange protein 2-like isoform X1 n=1 Tax=Varroa jacobsoni TaxID=62625 RepID=UPI000BF87CFA|nr:anion exchange protein 2-like isoform X1 [Varroa jacobsoni]
MDTKDDLVPLRNRGSGNNNSGSSDGSPRAGSGLDLLEITNDTPSGGRLSLQLNEAGGPHSRTRAYGLPGHQAKDVEGSSPDDGADVPLLPSSYEESEQTTVNLGGPRQCQASITEDKTGASGNRSSEKRPSLLKKAKEPPGGLPVQDFHRVDTGDEPLTSPEPRSRNPLDEHPKVGFIIGDEESHPGGRERKDKLREHTRDRHASGRPHRFHAYHQPSRDGHRDSQNNDNSYNPANRYRLDDEFGGLLSSIDQEDLLSHRFEDPRGFRRHIIHRAVPQRAPSKDLKDIDKDDKATQGSDGNACHPQVVAKKQYDHTPHEVFVELAELVSNQWKETARWIKYEENVEQDVDRWGAPHVASLSFNDLGVLKKCLGKAVVLLDLEEKDLSGICNRIVDAMVEDGQISSDNRAVVFRALLQSHHHVGEEPPGPLKFLRRSSLLGSGYFRQNSSTTSLHSSTPLSTEALRSASVVYGLTAVSGNSDDPQRNFSMPAMPFVSAAVSNHNENSSKQNLDGVKNSFSHHEISASISLSEAGQDLRINIPVAEDKADLKSKEKESVEKANKDNKENKQKSLSSGRPAFTRNNSSHSVSSQEMDGHHQQAILKRIPEDSEGISVMVAGLRSLEKTTVAFVRLADSQVLPNVIEVPLPVRFLFVCLGPEENDIDYHEIGRCISTLMSNKNFHEAAYAAEGRADLLKAFNQFLGETIVLPPGDYDNKALLPVEELRKKSEHIRRRRERMKRLSKKQSYKDDKTAARYGQDPSVYFNYVNALDSAKKGGDDFAPLRRTGRLFGGLRNEISKRYPQYLSDLTDGFNGQCLATAIFIYFAALAGAITFGGLLGDKTENLIGVSETLLVTFAGGVFFGMLAGQPLIIVGITGPVLLFDELLYNFCKEHTIDFLGVRVWIAAWCALIGLLVCAFEMSTFVCYFTRFTQEIFSALISLLYLYESLNKLRIIFVNNPLLSVDEYIYIHRHGPELLTPFTTVVAPSIAALTNPVNNSDTVTILGLPQDPSPVSVAGSTGSNHSVLAAVSQLAYSSSSRVSYNQPNTALMSLVLMFSTFLIADFFRRFKTSKFLSRPIRVTMGDFAMPIAIVTVVAVDYIVPNVYTQKLSVPDGLSTSTPTRGWLISPWGRFSPLQTWHIGVGALGGLLVFILLFLEVEICQLIMSKKERKTHKGTGFHLDLLLICFMELGCAFTGGPWLCAATVRCVSHLCALTVMSSRVAPGETPQVEGVREQRVTAVLVSLLIGLSVLMGPMLRQVPVAVLFGVFLYMGYTSMMGIQFFERVILLLKPTKYFPPVPYAQKVRALKMHGFTLLQILCLTLLWFVKQSSFALAFPFVLLCMIPIRLSLKWLFTERELQLLDGEGPVQDPPEDESLRL